ncbi:MAG: hypothetical protein A2986_03280 [Candidatus Jacksonbacteria bacterium RIFCSPLOWO2_01_FULL_44_13]|nr:MAG: hypothetical protein A2986_03280 [Candidatus Jacksonbacteria bacterium RIFCSPLOWO2_01_FULL_44_13]
MQQILIFIVLVSLPAYLIRFEVFGIPTTLLEMGIYAVACLPLLYNENPLRHLADGGGVRWKKRFAEMFHLFKPYLWPLLLWLGMTTVSAIVSATYGDWMLGFGILKGWFFDPLLLTWVVMACRDVAVPRLRGNVPGGDAPARRLYNMRLLLATGLLASALIISAYGLFDYMMGWTRDGRLDAFFKTSNYVSMFIVPVLILGVGMIVETPPWGVSVARWKSALMIIVMIMITTALILTNSFGGWISALIGVVVFFVFFLRHQTPPSCPSSHHKDGAQQEGSDRRPPLLYKERVGVRCWRIVFILISLMVLGAFVWYGLPRHFTHRNEFFNVTSSQLRQNLWRVAGDMVQTHPILGVGLGRFQKELPILIKQKPHLLTVQTILVDFHLPHNLYLTIASESGLIALLGFLWFIGLWLWRGAKQYISTRDPILLGALCAMLTILIHGFVDTPYFKNDLSILFWIVVVIGVLSSSERKYTVL